MNYASIRRMDISNGEGIRVSLFVSGCCSNCPGCFNKEAQSFDYGKPYTDEIEREILDLVSGEHVDGLSILGGDPLWQDDSGIQALISLVAKTHKLGKNVWLWSGFTWESIINCTMVQRIHQRELVSLCDVFIDGPFVEDKKDLSLHWRGSSNQRVIDVKESLKQNKVILYTN